MERVSAVSYGTINDNIGSDRMIKKSKPTLWWGIAVVAFLIFVLLQVPASWLISKFYKNNQMLKNVSGNIWQGQADWQKGALRGSVEWNTRPLDLILLRLAANVKVQSGQTELDGIVAYGLGKTVHIKQMNGQVAADTLKNVVNWQWPTNPIQLQELHLNYQPEKGFSKAEGQMQWAGGALIYTFGQRSDRMEVPSLKSLIQADAGKLILDVQDQRGQKMANLNLDPNLMLDVQLTQRLLQSVPSYSGKAGLDTYVMSSRQPLMRGGM